MSTKINENEISTRIASEKIGLEVSPVPRAKKKYTVTDKATRGEHLKKHQWKKGQSGNPKGRPINPLSLTALLNKKLSENPEDAEAIVNALIALGKGQDMRAIEMSFERVDGKVAETHKIEGEMPIRIVFVPAQQILGAQPKEIETKPLPELEAGSWGLEGGSRDG